jgi:hypothetical protein
MLLDKVSRTFNPVALPKFVIWVTSSVTTKPNEPRPFSVLGQQAMRSSRSRADIRIPVFWVSLEILVPFSVHEAVLAAARLTQIMESLASKTKLFGPAPGASSTLPCTLINDGVP